MSMWGELCLKVEQRHPPVICKTVIFTKATIASQSMNTTWTHGTRRIYPKLWRKPFPSGSVSQIFPWFSVFSPNSLSFPWLENWRLIFKVSLISRGAGNPVVLSSSDSNIDYPIKLVSWTKKLVLACNLCHTLCITVKRCRPDLTFSLLTTDLVASPLFSMALTSLNVLCWLAANKRPRCNAVIDSLMIHGV